MLRVTVVLLALLLPAAPAAAQQLTGFRSVLAQGQGTTATASDLAANQATGAVPSAFTNQLGLYRDLAVKWPGLTDDKLDTFFKRTDFTAAPPTGEGVRVDVPRPGVTITREPRFAVPRVDGQTRDDVMFGAGYAQAQDRLFLMDVLRRTARGSLSELVGPSGAEGDAQTLTQQDFSEAELLAQFEALDDRHGTEGARLQQDLRQFVAGINAFMDEVRGDPMRIPAEYPAVGATPVPWTIADTAAQAIFLVSQFNVAGLGERTNAAVLKALEERFDDKKRARRVFDELRLIDDREAPTTSPTFFADDRPGRVKAAAVALPDPETVKPRNPLVGKAPAPAAAPPFVQGVLNLPRALPPTKSNAVLLSSRFSKSGRPLASMGPQVGYFSPQIFSELELHGGGFDVQGVVFPGAAPYVLIGHGKGFSWSGTSPMSDLADTFAERLCDPEGRDVADPTKATHYLRRGRCVPFTTREQVLTTPRAPAAPDQPVEQIRLKTLRSVHGPVTHFAEVDGDPVALTQQKTVDGVELDAALAFARLNTNQLTDAQSFRRVWRDYPGGENWFYVSDKEMGFQLSGFMPVRAKGVDPDLPTWGTGAFDWRSNRLPFERLPHSVEPRQGFLISWNNREARGWRAPSDSWDLGPTHRSLLLERRLKAELKRGGGKIDLAGLVRTTEAAALADLEGQELLPLLRRLALPVATAEDKELLDLLETWRRRGAEHRDFDVDGQYDDGAAIALMRAWTPLLVRRMYEPALGADAMKALQGVLSLRPGRSEGGSWTGQLHRSLRQALGRKVRKAPVTARCRRARRTSCGRLVVAALRDAAAGLREEFEGGPDRWRTPVELTPITTAGAIGTPRFPIQNRGTYHQVIELQPAG